MTEPLRIEQEPDAIPGGRLVTMTAVTVLVGVIAVLAAWLLNPAPSSPALPHASSGPAFQPGTPEQSLIERSERGLALRAEQRSKLRQYGWVDRNAGVARIPIDRAIELRVEQSR